jgi:hypothetical protein
MSHALGSLTRRSKIGAVLVVLGIALLIVPSLASVQPVLYHETNTGATENETMLERQGYTVVEYEELSPRAQELYRTALRNDGHNTVRVGQGAEAFPYPSESELAEYEKYEQREIDSSIVIERPENADLPPADEPLRAAEYRARDETEGGETGETTTPSEAEIEQLRQQIARYDVINTRTGEPPLGGTQHLLRMAALLVGVVAVGTGGYLLSTHS